jgi:hypothetical protein
VSFTSVRATEASQLPTPRVRWLILPSAPVPLYSSLGAAGAGLLAAGDDTCPRLIAYREQERIRSGSRTSQCHTVAAVFEATKVNGPDLSQRWLERDPPSHVSFPARAGYSPHDDYCLALVLKPKDLVVMSELDTYQRWAYRACWTSRTGGEREHRKGTRG